MSLCSFIHEHFMPANPKIEEEKKEKHQEKQKEIITSTLHGLTFKTFRTKDKEEGENEMMSGLNISYFEYPRYEEHVNLVEELKQKENERRNRVEEEKGEDWEEMTHTLTLTHTRHRLFRAPPQDLHTLVQALFLPDPAPRLLAAQLFVKVPLTLTLTLSDGGGDPVRWIARTVRSAVAVGSVGGAAPWRPHGGSMEGGGAEPGL
jgi:hypothetical protein